MDRFCFYDYGYSFGVEQNHREGSDCNQNDTAADDDHRYFAQDYENPSVKSQAVYPVGEGEKYHRKHGVSADMEYDLRGEPKVFKGGVSRREHVRPDENADDGCQNVLYPQFHEQYLTCFLRKNQGRST